MLELCNEEPLALAMYDELTERLISRLIKQSTNFRVNLDPGLKVAVTLHHLAPGANYRNLRLARR